MFRLFPSARVDAVDHLYAAMSHDRTPLETAIPKSNLEAERKHQKLAEVELQQRLHAPVLDDDILPQRRTMLSPDDIVAVANAMNQLRAMEAQKTQPAAPAVAPVPQFRQFANPAPLGLGGFAMTTMVLSVFNAGLISASVEDVVLPLALWYGGVAQALAGMWEFAVGNTFGATAFTSYGFFWMSFATLKKFVLTDFAASNISSDTIHDGVGLFLLVWTIFSIYMMFASFRTTRALSLVFILLVPAFILLTVGAFRMNENATKAGGWFGIFCAATAWYISAAESINGTFKREIFPIGRMTAATPLIPVINAETLGSIFDGCKQTRKGEEMV